MLQDTQGASDDNLQLARSKGKYILEDTARGNVDGVVVACHDNDGSAQSDVLSQIDVASDCQVIQFEDFGDIGDSLLEV
jgi:hypothetical protein